MSFIPPLPMVASVPVAPITVNIPSRLADVERQVIEATLRHFCGRREPTAACLGISLKTLYNRLQQYREDDEENRLCRELIESKRAA